MGRAASPIGLQDYRIVTAQSWSISQPVQMPSDVQFWVDMLTAVNRRSERMNDGNCHRCRVGYGRGGGVLVNVSVAALALLLSSAASVAGETEQDRSGAAKAPMAEQPAKDGKTESAPTDGGSRKDGWKQAPGFQQQRPGGCRFRSNDLGLIA